MGHFKADAFIRSKVNFDMGGLSCGVTFNQCRTMLGLLHLDELPALRSRKQMPPWFRKKYWQEGVRFAKELDHLVSRRDSELKTALAKLSDQTLNPQLRALSDNISLSSIKFLEAQLESGLQDLVNFSWNVATIDNIRNPSIRDSYLSSERWISNELQRAGAAGLDLLDGVVIR